jgi:4'-phosphopantetheinyl transferase
LNPSAETILWSSQTDAPPLASEDAHVWATTLSVAPDVLETFAATLSPDETARANKFKFEKHRNRFIAGRGALRGILGQYLSEGPAGLSFVYLANGKPALGGEFADAGIYFNLAHTEDLALVAVTRMGDVGVDVEGVRPIKNVDELVARFFSRRENELFQKVPEIEKPAAFFNLWTRKEALLKATGEGITGSLNLVEVSFLPGEAARLLAIPGDIEEAAQWNLRELTPVTGFTGAIAIQAPDVRLECWKW